MKSPATTEIEKKYRVSRIPQDVERLTGILIEQGYLAIAADGTEIRLRRTGGRFLQTVKKGKGLVRTEVEIELSEAQFAALWPMTAGRRLSKRRYKVPLAGHVCELDVFRKPLAGLVLAEVEFSTIEDSRRFVPPDWFAEDVTEDERFKNKHLATHGMPSGPLDSVQETRA
jgi:CYTH domain-containing protein